MRGVDDEGSDGRLRAEARSCADRGDVEESEVARGSTRAVKSGRTVDVEATSEEMQAVRDGEGRRAGGGRTEV